MKVESSRSAGSASIKSGTKTGSGFAGNLQVSDSAGVASVTGTQYVGGIEGLFALQEVGGALDDRRAASQGAEVLDRLDDLRRGLLLGQIAPSKLAALAQISRQLADKAADSQLKSVLEEIELRAHVELAKLEYSA